MANTDPLEELRALKAQALKTVSAPQAPAQSPTDPVAELRALKANVQPTSDVAPAKTFQAAPNPPGLLETFGNGIMKGIAGFADAIPRALVNSANLGIAIGGTARHLVTGDNQFLDTLDPDMLSGYSKLGHASGVIDDAKNPVDMPGRIVDSVGQVIGGGGVNPRSITTSILNRQIAPVARSLVTPVASGVGSGVGSELTRGVDTGYPWLDNTIKTGATILGGMLPGVPLSARGTAGDRVKVAMNGVTPAQIEQANDLLKTAADQGTPITGYEAIQAVTGANPKMQTQQRLAEQSDSAARTLTPIMQARPANNAALMDQVTKNIPTSPGLPDTLAGTLQQSAQDAIDAARKSGNAQAAPFYATTSNDPSVKVPPHVWNALATDPRVAAALNNVKDDPFSGLHNAEPGSAQWLDAAKKYLDSQSQVAGRQGDNFGAANRSGAASEITSSVDPVLPDYAKARAIVAQNMEDNVVPMQNGQIGKLSNSNDFKQQSESLLPNAPADVTPQVLQNTATTIGAQNPDIISQFLAQDLKRKYAEATQQNMGGENTMGGAKFAANVAGNPMQEDNLMTLLRASGANPDEFSDALNTFRAQGYKPPVNSATSANLAEGAQLKNMVTSPLVTAKAFTDQWVNSAASKELAQALAAKENSISNLQNLARTSPNTSPMQQTVFSTIQNAPSVANIPGVTAPQIDLSNSAPVGIIAGGMQPQN